MQSEPEHAWDVVAVDADREVPVDGLTDGAGDDDLVAVARDFVLAKVHHELFATEAARPQLHDRYVSL